ncbi:MAG: T9SS type A sorting domain-containing protein, partial [Schleiferiaceae bacterium]|nr:T9SS type A sorting domain-containing protein [Schleiferiaceae bacterium]
NIGVSELSLPEFKVFPNPADNEVFITLKNIKGTLTLLNNLGQVIEEKQVDYSTTNLMMDVSTLPAGMYIIQIMNGNDQSTEKLIIE